MAANYDDRDREVTYEIVEEIGVIASSATGWTKELNVVAWNGGQGKYDIREWSPTHDRMSRGITLNEQEMRTILDLMRRRARVRPAPRRVQTHPNDGDREERRNAAAAGGDADPDERAESAAADARANVRADIAADAGADIAAPDTAAGQKDGTPF